MRNANHSIRRIIVCLSLCLLFLAAKGGWIQWSAQAQTFKPDLPPTVPVGSLVQNWGGGMLFNQWERDTQHLLSQGGTVGLSNGQLTLTTPVCSGNCGAIQESKQRFSSGIIEARVYFPASPTGTIDDWPAVWLMDQQSTWPQTGEQDLAEGLSGTLCDTYHYEGASGPANTPPYCYSNSPGWHTIDDVWTMGAFSVYEDGVFVHSISGGIVKNDPLHIFLQMSNGKYGNQPENVATERVQWVRVWTNG